MFLSEGVMMREHAGVWCGVRAVAVLSPCWSEVAQ